MVVFNGGGRSDQASRERFPGLDQAPARPSTNWTWPSFPPLWGRQFATDLGLRGSSFHTPRLLRASSRRTPQQLLAGGEKVWRAPFFAIRELRACRTSENCSVRETVTGFI